MNRKPRRIQVWTAPILLGITGAIGLIAALIADGVGDYIAWMTLAMPVGVVLWYAPKRAPRRDAQTTAASDPTSQQRA